MVEVASGSLGDLSELCKWTELHDWDSSQVSKILTVSDFVIVYCF